MKLSHILTFLLAPGVLGAPLELSEAASEVASDSSSPSAQATTIPSTKETSGEATTSESSGDPTETPTVSNSDTTSKESTPSTPSSFSDQSQTARGAAQPTQADGGEGYRNVLYFTNWGIYKADFQPQDLPVDKVTHILYAFADFTTDGQVNSSDAFSDLEKHYPSDSWNDAETNAYGCVMQIFLHKMKNRTLKVLLSIGGWTYSDKFPLMASTPEGRQNFASSAVRLVRDWGLDGLDIDWEYPKNATESKNLVELLKTCRQVLDEYSKNSAPGYHFQLTVASPADPAKIKVMDLEGMDEHLDAWHLMSYDYAGSWDETSGHQAALSLDTKNANTTKFNTEDALKAYLGRDISADKIVLGMPIYGRSFADTAGIGETFTGVGAGSIEPGVLLYKDLPLDGEYNKDVVGAYSYDPDTKELVSYDTVDSVKAKTEWLKDQGLGGAMFWEASGDRTGKESLVGTAADEMSDLDETENWLDYPDSKYINIRNQMEGGGEGGEEEVNVQGAATGAETTEGDSLTGVGGDSATSSGSSGSQATGASPSSGEDGGGEGAGTSIGTGEEVSPTNTDGASTTFTGSSGSQATSASPSSDEEGDDVVGADSATEAGDEDLPTSMDGASTTPSESSGSQTTDASLDYDEDECEAESTDTAAEAEEEDSQTTMGDASTTDIDSEGPLTTAGVFVDLPSDGSQTTGEYSDSDGEETSKVDGEITGTETGGGDVPTSTGNTPTSDSGSSSSNPAGGCLCSLGTLSFPIEFPPSMATEV